jgi:hypothetical protein
VSRTEWPLYAPKYNVFQMKSKLSTSSSAKISAALVENSYLSPLINVPNEVLSYIFVLCCCTCPLRLPYWRHGVPLQVIISHVCSGWRQVALSTGVLWNNIRVSQLRPACYALCLSIYKTWVCRAGNCPLSVALAFYDHRVPTRKVLLDFVVPFRFTTIEIAANSYDDFSPLSGLPPLDVEEFAILVNSFINDHLNVLPFVDKIRRIQIGNQYQGVSKLLPWNQLRSFECYISRSLSTWLGFLSQAQSLERCHLTIYHIGHKPLVRVCIPNLRWFTCTLHVHPDKVIPFIEAPNITTLGIYSSNYWSPNTYDIIRNHHKLHQLQQLRLHPGYSFPLCISQVLVDAPKIKELLVQGMPFLDVEAREGIASGRLGRCLTSLDLYGRFEDAGEWLDMIETRQRNVNLMISQVSNWRQVAFTGIRLVKFTNLRNIEANEERAAALKVLGSTVKIS